MSAYLDIVLSIILGSLLLLTIFSFNLDMSERNNINNLYLAAEKNGSDFQEILRNDLKKIGLGVPDTTAKFLVADSTHIKFNSDYDLNGTVNQIYYYLGNSDSANFTENQNDVMLYRKIDNNPPETYAIGLINLNFTYYDKNGNQTASLTAIREIGYDFYLESTVSYNGEFPGTFMKGRITPKNLK